MKIVKHQISNENILFFIKNYKVDEEIMNIEVLMKLSKNDFTENDFVFASVENDVPVSKEDMEESQLTEIIKNINIYKRDNLL